MDLPNDSPNGRLLVQDRFEQNGQHQAPASNQPGSSGRASTAASSFSEPKVRSINGTAADSLWRWWPEAALVATAVVFFAATVALLVIIDGSRQDKWQAPWQIKPSTLIAILIAVCRMAMTPVVAESIGQLKWIFFQQRPQKLSHFQTFDEASRSGPWGCLCLMWRLNWKATVASLGAFVTILLLAMDPFPQQVIYTDIVMVNYTDPVATIRAANLYNSGAAAATINSTGTGAPGYPKRGVSGDGSCDGDASDSDCTYQVTDEPPSQSPPGFSTGAGEGTDGPLGPYSCAESQMVRAAFGGLYNFGTQVPFSCPSGNCTWPEFTTLAIRSQCTDLSSTIAPNCTGSGTTGDTCQYTLSGKASDWPLLSNYPGIVSPDRGYAIDADFLGFQASSACNTADSGSLPGGTAWLSAVINRTNLRSYELLDFYSLRLPMDYSKAGSCKIPQGSLLRCSLAWSAETYSNASVVNGQLGGAPTATRNLVLFYANNSTCAGLREMKMPNSTYGNETAWQGLVAADYQCPAEPQDVKESDVFWINSYDHEMTANFLKEMLDAQTLATGSLETGGGTVFRSFAQTATLEAFIENNAGNVSATMDNIAQSMSRRIREPLKTTVIQGTSTSTTTVIRVSWYWLIYPAATIFLGITFFIITVFFSNERSRVIWKSSSLAVLFHGLPENVAAQGGRSAHDMETEAKAMVVKLEEDDVALRLVRH